MGYTVHYTDLCRYTPYVSFTSTSPEIVLQGCWLLPSIWEDAASTQLLVLSGWLCSTTMIVDIHGYLDSLGFTQFSHRCFPFFVICIKGRSNRFLADGTRDQIREAWPRRTIWIHNRTHLFFIWFPDPVNPIKFFERIPCWGLPLADQEQGGLGFARPSAVSFWRLWIQCVATLLKQSAIPKTTSNRKDHISSVPHGLPDGLTQQATDLWLLDVSIPPVGSTWSSVVVFHHHEQRSL